MLTQEVWRQIESFSGYSFYKAHSASFAVESFQNLFLKTYYPREFMVAVINNFGGFTLRDSMHEARMCGSHHPCSCVQSQFTLSHYDLWWWCIHRSRACAELEQKCSHTRLVEERLATAPIAASKTLYSASISARTIGDIDSYQCFPVHPYEQIRTDVGKKHGAQPKVKYAQNEISPLRRQSNLPCRHWKRQAWAGIRWDRVAWIPLCPRSIGYAICRWAPVGHYCHRDA